MSQLQSDTITTKSLWKVTIGQLSGVPSQLTTIRIRVQLMAIPQDSLIARHAARYWLCVRCTSALDFARHCGAAVISEQAEKAVVRFEGPETVWGSCVRTKPASPFFFWIAPAAGVNVHSATSSANGKRLKTRGLLGNVVFKTERSRETEREWWQSVVCR